MRFISVMILMITATFCILHILPGSPFSSETSLPPEMQSQLEARYHLHDSLPKQYFYYVQSLLQGDFGTSLTSPDQKVSQIIGETFPTTLFLGAMSLTLSFFGGIFFGILSVRFQKTWIETILNASSDALLSVPLFFIAPLLILIFSTHLDWLPPALWDGPRYYILPVIVLASRPMALVAKLVRAEALELLRSDFVRTARAKGLNESRVFFKHILKNSLTAVLGISGTLVAQILSGSFIVETIFAVPGLAHYFIESVLDRDYPLILGLSLLYTSILLLANLASDIFARKIRGAS